MCHSTEQADVTSLDGAQGPPRSATLDVPDRMDGRSLWQRCVLCNSLALTEISFVRRLEFSGAARKELAPEQQLAEAVAAGIVGITVTVSEWASPLSECGIDPGVLHNSLIAESRRPAHGDFAGAEAMLMAQAIATNTMFVSLARQSRETTHFEQFDRLLRLALKAQGQSRASIETLAMMKHQPLFAKQANISSGPQQVNNGIVTRSLKETEQQISPNKLLEAHGERMVISETSETADGDPSMEALGPLHRAKDERREEGGLKKRLPRRREAAVPRAGRRGRGATTRSR